MPKTLPFAALTATTFALIACLGEGSPHTPGPPAPPDLSDLPKTAGSFETAKRWLYEKVQPGHELTLYCGCSYDPARNVDLDSCGLQPIASRGRAGKIEAEHVVPASRIGRDRPCWTQPLCKKSSGESYKGRECCEDMDPWFESAHNDLHNLYPEVGTLNGDRGDYDFGVVAGEERAYGTCDFEVDREADRVEPPDGARGEVARAYLYMEATYGVPLTSAERALMLEWHEQDPPEAWEQERNARIREIQGKGNPFIE
jgi:deoxyribonuclease-1